MVVVKNRFYKKYIIKMYLRHCFYLIAVWFVTTSFNNPTSLKSDYIVDELYAKKDLAYGTIDEDGQGIDFIFIKTALKAGKYEIEITDGQGDLYEIKGTDLFLKFTSYYGYAGYGEEGLLIVNQYGASKFIKY